MTTRHEAAIDDAPGNSPLTGLFAQQLRLTCNQVADHVGVGRVADRRCPFYGHVDSHPIRQIASQGPRDRPSCSPAYRGDLGRCEG